jgi:hypothetical protein
MSAVPGLASLMKSAYGTEKNCNGEAHLRMLQRRFVYRAEQPSLMMDAVGRWRSKRRGSPPAIPIVAACSDECESSVVAGC